MNLLDVIIIVAAVAYGFTGFRNGAVVGLMSLIGFFIGAVLGAQLAGPLGSHLAEGRAQVPIAIVCVLMLAMLGQLSGIWIAGHIRTRLVRERGRPVDSGFGVLFGVLSVLLVSWMVAVPLASSPYPSLASEASESTIVRGVDDVMPRDVRKLYSSLRRYLDQSGFPPVFGDLPDTRIVNVPPPDDLPPGVQRLVRTAGRSTVKIYGQAPSCDRRTEGSGFVYARDRVMTNAHVVAGADQVAVEVNGQQRPATVVLYDPSRDVAVLRVRDLGLPTLKFASDTRDHRRPRRRARLPPGRPVHRQIGPGPVPGDGVRRRHLRRRERAPRGLLGARGRAQRELRRPAAGRQRDGARRRVRDRPRFGRHRVRADSRGGGAGCTDRRAVDADRQHLALYSRLSQLTFAQRTSSPLIRSGTSLCGK